MEVNKEEAERCRDMGAASLKQGQYARAIKLLKKSVNMYPLPGVEALLNQAASMQKKAESSSTSNGASSTSARPATASRSAPTAPAASGSAIGENGRAFTPEQQKVVKEILRAKEGGRGAHYRVLGVAANATEADLKKAYKKRALKVHPDKNSAPHADEAFKAVGLAYGTLSDANKRSVYDRYGDEDPDNRGGGAAHGPGGMHFRRGDHIDPDEIFNMFFGGGMGGMGGGGRGFHVYSGGFPGAGGVQFGGQRRQRGGGQQQQQQQQQPANTLMQFLPFILIMALSFLNFGGDTGSDHTTNKYFSLTQKAPYLNPLATKMTTVKDIPFFVTDKFLRTYYRDRYQLAQVERLVETTYHQYLTEECQKQKKYKSQLERQAKKLSSSDPTKDRAIKKAKEFEITRCLELDDLFPRRKQKYRGFY